MAKKSSRNREIKNILGVLGMAVICAALLAMAFIYYYGPSGRYLAAHTLLDPSILKKIHYQQNEPGTGKKINLVFDHIEFSYFDPKKGQVIRQDVPFEKYQKFYQLVTGDSSLTDATIPMGANPTVLTLYVRLPENTEGLRVFQVIQFVKEDQYRVQLKERQEQGGWVYFYHPRLYHEIMQLFAPHSI